jgi:hypothetical protein
MESALAERHIVVTDGTGALGRVMAVRLAAAGAMLQLMSLANMEMNGAILPLYARA